MSENRTSANKRHFAGAEAGQSIILMAFLMVGLLGALGLAIDGGRLFFARRDTQNAVDAAVLMASYALCNGSSPQAAGLDAAAKNGLVHDGEDVIVTVNNPPSRPMYAEDGTQLSTDVRYFVEVIITQRLDPFFIQFVYGGELMVTSDGIGYCRPAFDPMSIPAMFAASSCDNGCGDGNVTGSSSALNATISEGTFISPGGLFFSNGDIAINGSESAGHETLLDGEIETACDFVGKGTVLSEGTADPVQNADPRVEIPLPYHITDFAPGGYFAVKVQTNAQYDPDEYYAITPATIELSYWQAQGYAQVPEPYSWVKSGTWTVDGWLEGLYYVEFPAVIGNKTDWPTDEQFDSWGGVTIASTEDIKFNGGNKIKYYVGGFLLFSDFNPTPYACNSSTDGISASGETFMMGVLYAPWSGISFSANDITIIGAMLGQRVGFSASTVYYEYTPDILDPIPPTIQMAK